MTANHHLDDASIVRYASGDFSTEFVVVSASHLAMCSVCRKAVALAETAGGTYLDTLDTVELADDALPALMQRLDDEAAGTTAGASPAALPEHGQEDTLPLPLRRVVSTPLDAISWKSVGPGIHKHDIQVNKETGQSLFMLKIAPGKKVPEHGHGGGEMTLVLSGSYRDDLGWFGPGDIADLDEHVQHQPHVDSITPCICLVATEAPTRFTGWISRIVQPFVGI